MIHQKLILLVIIILKSFSFYIFLISDIFLFFPSKYYIVVQSLVINIGTCFASSYNVFRADDLSYGNVFRERSSRKTLPHSI